MALGLGLAAASCLAACSSSTPERRLPLELAIDQELGAKLGVAVVTRCSGLYPACMAELADGTRLPVDVGWRGGAFEWRLRGWVITTAAIEGYVRDEVTDLGAAQGVRCAPPVRVVAPGDQLECWLERGGKAFVTIRGDRSIGLELALEPGAAAARSEIVTPAREHELEAASRKLAHLPDDEDDNDNDEADPNH